MSRKNKNGIYVNNDRIVCDRYSFEGSAESVKTYIDYIVAEARKKGMIDDGRFDISSSRGYYVDDDEISIYYEFDRTETEKEKISREKAETKHKEEAAKKRKAAADAKKLKTDAEYAEFLRLKEKFKEIET
jgi:hypothetical protein